VTQDIIIADFPRSGDPGTVGVDTGVNSGLLGLLGSNGQTVMDCASALAALPCTDCLSKGTMQKEFDEATCVGTELNQCTQKEMDAAKALCASP
jgi:hypothetical protein